MKTLLLINEKGGVGKTTLATTLATALAASGQRVLLVDGDAQGNATMSLRAAKEDGFAGLMLQNAAFQDVLRRVDTKVYGGSEDSFLFVLPGSKVTSKINKAIADKEISPLQLNARLQELEGYIDYTIIDTSPTISELHTAFYFAADYTFYPTQCEYFAIEGLKSSIKHLQSAQAAGEQRGLKVAAFGGIIPNMFNGRELVQYQNLGWLQGNYGNEKVLDPLRLLAVWKQAAQKRSAVFSYDRHSKGAKEALTFVEQVMERAS